jgi:hypothetical protein
MKLSSIGLFLIGAGIFVGSAATIQAASAQTAAPPPGQGPTMRVACGADLRAHCPGLRGKDARLCLRAYHAQITPECTTFLAEAQAKRAAGAMGKPPAGGAPPPSAGDQ